MNRIVEICDCYPSYVDDAKPGSKWEREGKSRYSGIYWEGHPNLNISKTLTIIKILNPDVERLVNSSANIKEKSKY